MSMKLGISPVLVVAVFAALFQGCASSGTKIDPAAVSQIERGVTTKAQLVAALGNPISASMLGNGRELLVWSYAQTRVKGRTFIPVVGAFAGGADTKMETLQVILDSDKVVEDYLWNNSQIETKTGL